jgi:hypothetical protein
VRNVQSRRRVFEGIPAVDEEAPIERTGKQLLERLVYHVKVSSIIFGAFASFKADPEDDDLVIDNMTCVPTRNAGQSTVRVEG